MGDSIDMNEKTVPMEDFLSLVRGQMGRRAGYIAVIYDELSRRQGKDVAFDVISTAIKNYGRWFAKRQMQKNPELRTPDTRHWLPKTPWEARIMEKKMVDVSEDKTILTENYCAMVEAWKEMGKSEDEIRVLCDIAMYLEEGMNEEYPITITSDHRIGCGDKCCRFTFEKK
jgi:hypothetical protein